MTVQGTNCHASFIVPTSTTAEQNAYIIWHGTPTPADSWMVDITGHNSASFSSNGSSVLQLAVVNTETIGTPNGVDAYVISMEQGHQGSTIPLFGTTQWRTNGYTPRVSVSTTSVDFAMRLVYLPTTHSIQAWYDTDPSGAHWTWLDTIGLTDFSPSMTASNTFSFAILSNTYYGPITEGEIWADYFYAGPLPVLAIIRSGTDVTLAWPTNATGFTLQSTTNLVSPSGWITNSAPPVVVNGQNIVTNSISGTQMFYRLSQ